jgi:hypothetical protein
LICLQRIQSASGNKGLVLFLKTCAVCLQQAASGHRLSDLTPLKSRISRTKGSKLPRIIPVRSRRIILNKRPGYTIIIRFYLSLFYVYRVIKFDPVESLSSITEKGVDFNMGLFERYIERFLDLFIKDDQHRLIPVFYMKNFFSKYFSINRSSPFTSLSTWSSHPVAMIKAASALMHSPISLEFSKLARCFGPSTLLFTVRSLGLQLPGRVKTLGKLGFKVEAAGKLRVFAMVDPFTQWLLYPLHKLIFSILRKIPMDGTFNQLRPVKRLLRLKPKALYSLDLSAATDRLPISLQSMILDHLIAEIDNFGSLWARLLVGRGYKYTLPISKESGIVTYSVGQPMGALSSWAMLALTHHFIVQVAAWRVGFPKTKLYQRYAILGDDIVIGDKYIADSYLQILSILGVKVGLAKSVISSNGSGLEFAKRTFIDSIDVSPLSLKELAEAVSDVSAWAAFSNKWGMSFHKGIHILGYGYKTNTETFRKMNHALRVIFLSMIPRLSFTAHYLGLGNKFPKDLEGLLPQFKQEVLKPAVSKLMTDMASIPNLTKSVGLLIETPENLDDLLRSFKVSEKPDYYQISRPVRRALDHCYDLAYRTVLISESTKVLRDLRGALDLVHDLSSITSMDQALEVYLKLLRARATTDLQILRLNKVVRRPGMLPFQARLFRSWSRLTHKLARIQDQNKT